MKKFIVITKLPNKIRIIELPNLISQENLGEFAKQQGISPPYLYVEGDDNETPETLGLKLELKLKSSI